MARTGRSASTAGAGASRSGSSSSSGSSGSGSSGSGSSGSGSSGSGSSGSGSSGSGSSGSGSRGSSSSTGGVSSSKTTTSTSPYAKTQTGRKTQVNSVSQISVSENKNTKAQPTSLTYATNTKTGQTYTIPSNLSLEARQHYAKLGIATSSIPPNQTGFQTESPVEVTVDPNLLNIDVITEDVQQWNKEYFDQLYAETLPPDMSFYDTDLNDVRGDDTIANEVQFNANVGDTIHPIAPNADKNWNMGNNLYTGTSDESLYLLEGTKYDTQGNQYLPQINDIIVPRPDYLVKEGSGKLDAGIDNFKLQLGNIMSSKYFPFLALGFIVIIVIMLLRGKGSSAPQIPTSSKVINF